MSPSRCYHIHCTLYYIMCDGQRLVTNPQTLTHARAHTHARRLTHTSNQLRYCRIPIYEDIIYTYIYIYTCILYNIHCSVCPCGAFGRQLFIYTN